MARRARSATSRSAKASPSPFSTSRSQASASTPPVPQQRPELSQNPGRSRSGSPEVVTVRQHRSTSARQPVTAACGQRRRAARGAGTPGRRPPGRGTSRRSTARARTAICCGSECGTRKPSGPASLRATTSATPGQRGVDQVAAADRRPDHRERVGDAQRAVRNVVPPRGLPAPLLPGQAEGGRLRRAQVRRDRRLGQLGVAQPQRGQRRCRRCRTSARRRRPSARRRTPRGRPPARASPPPARLGLAIAAVRSAASCSANAVPAVPTYSAG